MKKVLIVRLSAMGDVIFNIPLANILKYNGYEVTWIVSEKGYELIKDNPAVDETILAPIEKWKKQPLKQNIKEYFEIIKYLRSKKFDIAIDTQLLLKSCIWTAFCGAKRRIVSKSAREFAILGGNEVIEKLRTDFSKHVTNNYLKFARHLNINFTDIKVTLPPVTDETKQKVDELLKGIDTSKPILTLAPATTWETKHWNKNNWRELVSRLENDYTLIFTGTSGDEGLIKYISGGNHLSVAGKTSILELAEVYRRSELLISLDSGSTHLAWATGVPKIVSIFCSTPASHYAPLGSSEKYIAVSGTLPCQPCHKKHCPMSEGMINQCTMYPSVDEVYDAIQKLCPINTKCF
ncbi:MAG: glycosyltransferase family 9 protein [bacterium]|nr:glycosyltransferase family 9 protein [bacterium]